MLERYPRRLSEEVGEQYVALRGLTYGGPPYQLRGESGKLSRQLLLMSPASYCQAMSECGMSNLRRKSVHDRQNLLALHGYGEILIRQSNPEVFDLLPG